MVLEQNKQWELGALGSLIALVFFLLSLLSSGAHAVTIDDYKPHAEDQRHFLTQPREKTQRDTDIYKKRMLQNGLKDAIDKIWGNQASLGQAIAAMENSGMLSNINSLGATCAFQVTPINYPTTAKALSSYYGKNIAVADVQQLINKDPVACAIAGKTALDGLSQRKGGADISYGLCRYAGGWYKQQWEETGSCVRFIVLQTLIGFFDGTLTAELQGDYTKPDYLKLTIKKGGQEVMITYLCQDRYSTLAKALAAAARSYQYATLSQIDGTYQTVMDAEAQKPPDKERGNAEDAYCLARVVKFFDNIGDLLGSIIDSLINMVIQMIEQVINAACQAVATVVNNLLSAICIPIPRLNFGLSIPGLERKSCDGISLATFISLDAGHFSASSLMNGGETETSEDKMKPMSSEPTGLGDTGSTAMTIVRNPADVMYEPVKDSNK